MHSPSDEESLFAEDSSEGPSSSSSPSFPVAYSFADSFGSDRISSTAAKHSKSNLLLWIFVLHVFEQILQSPLGVASIFLFQHLVLG